MKYKEANLEDCEPKVLDLTFYVKGEDGKPLKDDDGEDMVFFNDDYDLELIEEGTEVKDLVPYPSERLISSLVSEWGDRSFSYELEDIWKAIFLAHELLDEKYGGERFYPKEHEDLLGDARNAMNIIKEESEEIFKKIESYEK